MIRLRRARGITCDEPGYRVADRPVDSDRDRDRGASLVMAVGFVVLVGSIAAGLAGLITSSNLNRVSLASVRDRQYAADGAIEEAITAVRALDRAGDGSCDSDQGFSTSDLNGHPIHVDWEYACGAVRTAAGELVAQRNVIFSACDDVGRACADSEVIVRAQVNFEQAATGEVTRTWVQSWSVLNGTTPTTSTTSTTTSTTVPTTTTTVLAVPAGCSPAGPDHWTMEIYDGNALAGPLVSCSNVANIDMNWGSGTPDPAVGSDYFSIRWSRVVPFSAGTYQFSAGSDDGVRVYVDGTLFIDYWNPRSYRVSTGTITLPEGDHTVVMEFYENGGAARATLTWVAI
jgi:hypothetical protein